MTCSPVSHVGCPLGQGEHADRDPGPSDLSTMSLTFRVPARA